MLALVMSSFVMAQAGCYEGDAQTFEAVRRLILDVNPLRAKVGAPPLAATVTW